MTTSDCKYCETWCAPCNPYRGVVSDERADPQSELAALRARIAELEAPVLPETVARVVAELTDAYARTNLTLYQRAAALLTRLSSFSEEDVERAAHAVFMAEYGDKPAGYFAQGGPMRNPEWDWYDEDQHNQWRKVARAALTAHLRQTGERG